MERPQQYLSVSSPNSSTKSLASSNRHSGPSEASAPGPTGTGNLEEGLRRGESLSFNGQPRYTTPILPKATVQVGTISGPAGSSIASFSATTPGLIDQLSYDNKTAASHYPKSQLISTNRPSMDPSPTIYPGPCLQPHARNQLNTIEVVEELQASQFQPDLANNCSGPGSRARQSGNQFIQPEALDLPKVAERCDLPADLIIPASKIGKRKKGNWTGEETEALLTYLAVDENYKAFKLNATSVMEKLAQSIFQGTRSGRALEGRWKAMKEKYDKAKVRINSTGEGEKSEEEWASMRRTCLNRDCPYYEEIKEILQKDKSFTPLAVSETGKGRSKRFHYGLEVEQEWASEFSDIGEGDSERQETEDDEATSTHPAMGGRKNPEKSKSKSTDPATSKALARKKPSATDALLQGIASQRLAHEKEEFEYVKQRDEADRELQKMMEENRSAERMQRLALMEAQIHLQSQKLELELEKIRGQAGGEKRKRGWED